MGFQWQYGMPFKEKFWSRVRKSEGCWEWNASTRGSGYGSISVMQDGRQRFLYAHRVSYEMAFGPIPAGLFVCHRCDNKSCVRPDHLFLGTAKDNALDAQQKGLIPTRKAPVLKGYFHPAGELSARAKVTDQDVRAMRAGYAEGRVSMSQLAKLYGLDISGVSRIINRQRWRHIA